MGKGTGKDIEAAAERTVSISAGSEKKIVASRDIDEALKFLEANAGTINLEDVDEKKLMRKVDWMLMPLMFLCYYLQYSDKTLINYAAVMGIIEDTNLPPNGFSNLAMAFYVSFLVCEPLQTYFIQRLPVGKWLGANVVLWGITVACNCAVSNYASVIALRVLLGAMEACVAPALVVVTGMWYRRSEQVSRMGIWYQGTSLGPAISSLISYGFLHYANSNPNANFKSWQILFLLYGLITIVVGICVLCFLPDNPMKSRLSDAEKIFIINRVRGNETGIENKHLKWAQVKEVFVDIRTWLIALIVIATNVPNGAVSSFQSIIISSFGFDEYETLLLNLPSAAVSFIAVAAGSFLAGKYNARCIVIICLIIPTMMGGALMAWLPADNNAGLLAGNYMTSTVGASLPLLYSWITANYAGHSKKTTMSAIVLMSFCIGNIIGPKTFRDSDAPAYIPAKICIVAFLACAILLALTLDGLYLWENKRRDKMGVVDMPEDFELLDLTDKENKRFRYLL
ncbi:uncharacterized protein HMPREF1541_01539 [Cyphellophora europaea CBS 101466]|uniref:Major facilitator superfamily (MFS) profile domain-containing protein n=1 Tax=Cyphellophora europaea (strain CBS 101466) TaxID=1220924 RepID=W2S1E2_CYPE1|nr:uncharacterized protein HMPREF1541_01539 [Cyphellophora europaea CBS 101466]ETN42385.1 hypothetical protein HMPREF1541_01539 [Cyphellophora europaea CBS 101466]